MNFKKKYTVVDNYTGEKYEVIADELGYLHHKQPEPKPEAEVKPVSFKDIERLYKKEFPTKPTTTTKPINEVKKLKQLIDNNAL